MSHRLSGSDRFGALGRSSALGPILFALWVAGAGCSSNSATPPDGGVGVVMGEVDNHCSGVEAIMVSQASCHPAADAGAPPEPGDGGEPVPPVHFNGASDDDDCKYHVAFTSTPVVKNQNVTFNVTLTKLAENNAPATGGDVTIESFLLENQLHPIPNNGTKTTESPAGSGKYTVTPVKFDASGRWVVRFHFYERCEDILEDSPHGHVAFYYDVP
jgi:hypothetical protein